ncbi:MAG: HAD family hydrolase, partial [Fibrobacterota bacterium]
MGSNISDRCAGSEKRHRGFRQNLSDAASGAYLAVVVVVAVVAFAAWSLAAPESGLVSGLVGMIGVLLVACPFGLGVIAPISVGIATRKAAAIGVSFADARAIQGLHAVDTIVVARTGTLVRGFPKVVSVLPIGDLDEKEMLRLAASLESGSRHPIGLAVVKDSVTENVKLGVLSGFESIAGKGVRGMVDGRPVAIGNLSMMGHHGLALGELALRAEQKRSEGMITVYMSVDGLPAGIICFCDGIVENAPSAIRALRKSGLRVVMLTGECRTTAEELAHRLGIDEVIPETPPGDRLRAVEGLRANGWKVAVMGDAMEGTGGGAGRPVSVSIGTDIGTRLMATVTIDAGGLHGVAKARSLAAATIRSIRQNLIVVFGIGGIGVVIAAGALYPGFGIRLSPGLVAAVAV